MTLFERTDLRKLLFRIATDLENQESQMRRIRIALDEISDLMQQSQAANGKQIIFGDKSEECYKKTYKFCSAEFCKTKWRKKQRRNSKTCRSILALKLKPMIAGQKEKNLHLSKGKGVKGSQKSDDLNDTKKELAKVAGVSHDTIDRL